MKITYTLGGIALLAFLCAFVLALWFVAPFAAAVIFSRHPDTQTQVYGTYVADYGLAAEKLFVKEDGIFEQEVVVKQTSEVSRTTGPWSYNARNGYITFHRGFMLVVDGARKLKPDYNRPLPGSVVLPVDEVFGDIQMGSDEGVLYKKVNSGN